MAPGLLLNAQLRTLSNAGPGENPKVLVLTVGCHAGMHSGSKASMSDIHVAERWCAVHKCEHDHTVSVPCPGSSYGT